MAKYKIAVAICSYDRYELLNKCIESVINQDYNKNEYEILIVDNSPKNINQDKFYKKFNKATKSTRYLFEPIPGLSQARNHALNECDSTLIAYIDDDAIAHPNWLTEVWNAYQNFEDSAGIIGGKIDPIWESAKPSWLHEKLISHFTVIDWGGSTRIAGENEWLAGANITFKSDFLKKINGFPTNLGRVGKGNILLSNEEISVLEQFVEAGYTKIYAPKAVVDHLVPDERLSQEWIRKRLAWQAVSDLLKDPDQEINKEALWNNILDYLNSLPPHLRTTRGFFEHLEDPESFRHQSGVTYSLLMLLLGGFEVKSDLNL